MSELVVKFKSINWSSYISSSCVFLFVNYRNNIFERITIHTHSRDLSPKYCSTIFCRLFIFFFFNIYLTKLNDCMWLSVLILSKLFQFEWWGLYVPCASKVLIRKCQCSPRKVSLLVNVCHACFLLLSENKDQQITLIVQLCLTRSTESPMISVGGKCQSTSWYAIFDITPSYLVTITLA